MVRVRLRVKVRVRVRIRVRVRPSLQPAQHREREGAPARSDQVGEQILARVVASLGDHLDRVLGQLSSGLLDDVELVEHGAVEDPEHVLGPA